MAAHERDEGPLSILEAIDGRPKRRDPAVAAQSRRRRVAWASGGLLALVLGGWGLSQWQGTELAASPRPMAAASAVGPAASAVAVAVPAQAASTPALVEALPQGAASAVAVTGQGVSSALPGSAPVAAEAMAPVAALAGAAAATSLAATEAVEAPAKPTHKKKRRDKDADSLHAAAAGAKAEKAPPATAARGKAGSGAHRDADVDLIAALMRHADPVAPAAGVATAPSARSGETSIAGLVARCKTLAGAEAKACRRRICDGYWGKAEACPAKLAPKHSTTLP